MSMRALLAVLDHQAPGRALMETACAFATRWQSRLEVLLPYPGVWSPELLTIADESVHGRIEAVVAQVRDQEEAYLRTTRDEFEACCERFSLPIVGDEEAPRPCAHWNAYADLDRGLQAVRQARLADLIFLQRTIVQTGTAYEDLVNQILDGAGRPILLTPPRPATGGCGRIAIAWNGSAEAARAVASAIELIGAAESVDILTAESEHTPGAASHRLARYLASHDVQATRHVLVDRRNRSVAESILDKCIELGSDLLVMGAFSRTRLRERIFGGVTRHVLAHAELPVLMAH